jgi:hypothetical protein
MLQRLAAGNETPWDLRWAEHELYEAGLMDAGVGPWPAHQATLDWQGIPYEPGYEKYLYHPDIIEELPEYFNPACQIKP